jgi:hypothetical protein
MATRPSSKAPPRADELAAQDDYSGISFRGQIDPDPSPFILENRLFRE